MIGSNYLTLVVIEFTLLKIPILHLTMIYGMYLNSILLIDEIAVDLVSISCR